MRKMKIFDYGRRWTDLRTDNTSCKLTIATEAPSVSLNHTYCILAIMPISYHAYQQADLLSQLLSLFDLILVYLIYICTILI